MLNKRMNEYADIIPADVYRDIPKAVFAAMVVSWLSYGGDYMEKVRDGIAAEWWALYNAGIVPQRPTIKGK